MALAEIGFVGLGRMGAGAVRNLLRRGRRVAGTDRDPESLRALEAEGMAGAPDLASLVERLESPRILWLLVPHGVLDSLMLGEGGLTFLLDEGDVVVDGGNSFWRDSVRRGAALAEKGIRFCDCGSSGGLEGAEHGMCLMYGADSGTAEIVAPFAQALAVENGAAHVGPVGSGHFVKMVHNGIEYGMLQAIGEGFELLEDGAEGTFDLDLRQVAGLWRHGSVIRSWLMDLAERAFEKDGRLDEITGAVGGGSTGRWTIEEAWRAGVPAPVIAMSYAMRLRSRQDDTFTGKVVAALRNEFGGHATTKAE
jgi:6-phosphogluconate dehydrogenase